MHKIQPVAALVLFFILTGCATVFTGTTQPVNIAATDSRNNSTPASVICTVTDSNAFPQNVTSPGLVTVSKGFSPLQISCRDAEGRLENKTQAVGASFNPVTLLNFFFGIGFIIDGVSGAMMKYPANVIIPMQEAQAV